MLERAIFCDNQPYDAATLPPYVLVSTSQVQILQIVQLPTRAKTNVKIPQNLLQHLYRSIIPRIGTS